MTFIPFSRNVIIIACLAAISSVAQAVDYQVVQSFAPQGEATFVIAVDVEADGSTVYVNTGSLENIPWRTTQKFTSSGVHLGNLGFADSASAVATDPQGSVYVADSFGKVIQGYGVHATTFDPFPSSDPFGDTIVIATDAVGNVWAADGKHHVTQFANTGELVQQFEIPGIGSLPNDSGPLSDPSGIAVDASGNRIFVSLGANALGYSDASRIIEFAPDGTVVQEFGSFGSGDGELRTADLSGVALDANSLLYVADRFNNRIQVFDTTTGQYVTQFGNGLLSQPLDVAVDSHGNVWVVDRGSNRIIEFSPVPEPGSWLLMALAGLWFCYAVRAERRAN